VGLGNLAAAVGRGLVAGMAGVAAMNVATTVEMRLTGREPSTVPAEALKAVVGIEPRDERAEQRLNWIAHWGYGTSLGALRGLLGAAGLPAPAATATHFAVIYSIQQVLLPALGVARPTWTYGARALALDAGFHATYAVATGAAFQLLERDGR
jgi:hypothetical protein